MAQQHLKKLVVAIAVMGLGVGLPAAAQPVQSKDKSGGPVQAKDSSGGPVQAKDPSGGPVPAKSNEGMPMQSNAKASGTGASKSGSLDSGDRKFMETAAKDGLAEVELGKIASQKGQSSQVKEFGSRMVTDHGKANDELKSLASTKGVTLPTTVDSGHQKDADKMNKLAGDKFDKEYMEHMVKEHKKDVKEFEKHAKSAKDADVRAFASKTLPVLQEHLKMAESAQAAVKNGGKGGASK